MIPSFFIAHGAPLLAIEKNDYTQFLQKLGKILPRPKAIVLFTAHWTSGTQMVSNVDEYETIHDFYGFPEEMYKIKYPATGDATLANEIEALLSRHGIPCDIDSKRGLDHGAWVVLSMLYPDGDIPVISMSVAPNLSPSEQYKIGKSLADIRAKDVLVIASGGTVHNLRAVRFGEENHIDEWAEEFEDWLEQHVKVWDLPSLFQYQSLAPHAQHAVPPHGVEHFIPLFYAMGAADSNRNAKLLHRSYRYGNLSHSVWQFG
ncbi:DODA-type extradiol aromatic ring-opening family dioxygenase [Bacillus marasmi]|uniref:DODA-type extradiol aromatic ring-opening family dioxygenase n=1 Tax=Bacillus marasmi TaxID=1926279 RepID=UPI0011C76121|nr:class III extradiol ring-cleavage dioxygenase [Bacillus marasmi]